MTFYHTEAWNDASITATNNLVGSEDYRYYIRWTAIRNCNIILERLGDVPDLDETYKNQVTGEVKFIRALNYAEMLKRYGGVPIIDKRQSTDNTTVKRGTVEEMVNFIVKDCDDAVAMLPATYPSNFRGRATKTAAQLLKARTLLYAASPLFNTARPYLSLGNDNKLICYGNEDGKRWQLAADAAKAAIDLAPAGGFTLITDKGVDKNYKFVWEQNDNAEIVLAEKAYGSRARQQFPWYGIQPSSIVGAFGGITVTHNFVRKYEKKDGTPQTWNLNGGGSDLNKKYAELDPRFAQTVGYNGSYWNRDVPVLETFETGRYASGCKGGAWMKKLIPDVLSTTSGATANSIVFRMAEAYLNYAEALNEAQGPVPAAHDAVNVIRQRSGMPKLPATLTKDQFRERVRNERAIELAFEDHRLWDIRRWLIAENDGVMRGAMYGLRIYKIAGSTEFRYEPYVFETRTFAPRMYLHPFLNSEVFKGYLVQNPGW